MFSNPFILAHSLPDPEIVPGSAYKVCCEIPNSYYEPAIHVYADSSHIHEFVAPANFPKTEVISSKAITATIPSLLYSPIWN